MAEQCPDQQPWQHCRWRCWRVRVWYQRVLCKCKSAVQPKMVRPGFEPGTFCVLDRCDNQLRHRTASILRGENCPMDRLRLILLVDDYHGHLWPLGMSFRFIHWNRALELEKVINKAGGLVYQRNFAGMFALLRLLCLCLAVWFNPLVRWSRATHLQRIPRPCGYTAWYTCYHESTLPDGHQLRRARNRGGDV
jgi:hypothetical protein